MVLISDMDRDIYRLGIDALIHKWKRGIQSVVHFKSCIPPKASPLDSVLVKHLLG